MGAVTATAKHPAEPTSLRPLDREEIEIVTALCGHPPSGPGNRNCERFGEHAFASPCGTQKLQVEGVYRGAFSAPAVREAFVTFYDSCSPHMEVGSYALLRQSDDSWRLVDSGNGHPYGSSCVRLEGTPQGRMFLACQDAHGNQGRSWWGLNVVRVNGDQVSHTPVFCLYDNTTQSGCEVDESGMFWFTRPTVTSKDMDGDGRTDLVMQITVGRVAPTTDNVEKCKRGTGSWLAELKADRLRREERATVTLALHNTGSGLSPDADALARVKSLNHCPNMP
jgi:hypothetical protein